MSDWAEFLNERPVAVIATVGADGAPHAVPVEVVVHDGKVYTWGHAQSVRARNVARNGIATLTAYKGGSAFVMVQGSARTFGTEEPDYEELTKRFLEKYQREETYGNDTMLEITPEKIVQRS